MSKCGSYRKLKDYRDLAEERYNRSIMCPCGTYIVVPFTEIPTVSKDSGETKILDKRSEI